MITIENILVSNHSKGIKNIPLLEYFKGQNKTFKIDITGDLIINNGLICHVSQKLYNMRRLEVNKNWFKKDLFHLEPTDINVRPFV